VEDAMKNKKIFKRLDYFLIFVILILLAMSVVVVAVSTATPIQGDGSSLEAGVEFSSYYIKKQIILIGAAMVAMIVALSIDYNTIGRYWKLIYFLNILLLIFVKFFGATRKGAQSWIDLGFFDLLPPASNLNPL